MNVFSAGSRQRSTSERPEAKGRIVSRAPKTATMFSGGSGGPSGTCVSPCHSMRSLAVQPARSSASAMPMPAESALSAMRESI